MQRFIGVIYRPGTERRSPYTETWPAAMYDALPHLDTTSALTPLESEATAARSDQGKRPDPFPTGE